MLTKEQIAQQLPFTLSGLNIPEAEGYYSGKVRECYSVKSAISDTKRILVATDRLSAFDRILTTIPFKGALLSQMTAYWFDATKHLVPNHVIEVPHPNVFICEEVDIVPIEVVVSGYLTGSAWRDYLAGNPVSGVRIKPGKRKNEKFSVPLITPSTKAEIGKHDIPISGRELVQQGVVEQIVWDEISEKALALFEFGSQRAAERGLILVDTKYEFGLHEGKILLMDEIHTPDSSRYYYAEGFDACVEKGETPRQLSKEFLREWLLSEGFMGKEGQSIPEMTDERVNMISERYLELFEIISGKKLDKNSSDYNTEAIEKSISTYLG